MRSFILGIKVVMVVVLLVLSTSNSFAEQLNEDEGYVGIARYSYVRLNEPALYIRLPVGERFSLEGSAATLFDYVARANAYYHLNSDIKLGVGMVEFKSGSFKNHGARLSAGYQIVRGDNWYVGALAGREFVLGDYNFVEMQLRYQFSERFSVFYHLQHNFSRRNEGYLGVGYRF